ncbi:hypothetical protein FJ365_04440 [Candidatus Dependentiae bacterium]|nr:hypothetical protein [Candidatus Dependentiae bacterium]
MKTLPMLSFSLLLTLFLLAELKAGFDSCDSDIPPAPSVAYFNKHQGEQLKCAFKDTLAKHTYCNLARGTERFGSAFASYSKAHEKLKQQSEGITHFSTVKEYIRSFLQPELEQLVAELKERPADDSANFIKIVCNGQLHQFLDRLQNCHDHYLDIHPSNELTTRYAEIILHCLELIEHIAGNDIAQLKESVNARYEQAKRSTTILRPKSLFYV